MHCRRILTAQLRPGVVAFFILLLAALSVNMMFFSNAQAADNLVDESSAKPSDNSVDKSSDKPSRARNTQPTAQPPSEQAADKPVKRVGSQFFYQAPSGTQSTTLTVGYESDSTTATVNGKSTNQTVAGISPIGVTYEYGFNKKYALGAGLAYANESSSGTPGQSGSTISGIGDLDLTFKAISRMKKMALHYGVLAVVPNGSHTYDNSGNQNTASGGFALDPYIGLETIVGHGYLGTKFTYDYQADRSVGTPTNSEAISGGSSWELAVFYELKLRSTLLGADLRYFSIGNQTANGTTLVKDYTETSIDLYSDIVFSSFELIPKLAYCLAVGGGEFSKGDFMNFSIAGRWAY